MTSIRRGGQLAWVMFTALAIALLATGLVVGLGLKQISDNHAQSNRADRFASCVADWADRYTARANRIDRLAAAKAKADDDQNRAIDALILAQTPSKADIALLKRTSQAQLAASDAYNKARKLNPIPQAPRLACGKAHP